MHYDMTIVGGGLVGVSLAVALRESGLKIALIDARLPSNTDPRLFALNYPSCEFLKKLGVWSVIASEATPIQQVHVSRKGYFGAVRLQGEDVGLPTLGYVIPARLVEGALNHVLSSLSNVTLYRPATLTSLTQHAQGATLVLNTETETTTIQSSIVIGADGTDSTVRSLLDIKTETVAYQQTAIVTRTTLQRSHQHIAYERFDAEGAIAMLPLAENECATIWTADESRAQTLLALADSDFLRELQQAFGTRLGPLQQITKRYHFPLRMVRSEKSSEGCVLLLGNAAHTLHPIAAQGFNLALYEVSGLVAGILDRLAEQKSIHFSDLTKIHDQTKGQQAMSIGVSHRLSRLFKTKSKFKSCILQLGMIGFDTVLPIKTNFLKRMLAANE